MFCCKSYIFNHIYFILLVRTIFLIIYLAVNTIFLLTSVATVKTSTFGKCVIVGAINYIKL
jgi:hypothetical protein